MAYRGPRPTLGQLRRSGCWTWVNCANWQCGHRVPMALAPLIIRWGPDASSDVLRQRTRCTKCGRRGVTLQAASWGGEGVGPVPFPVEEMAGRPPPPFRA